MRMELTTVGSITSTPTGEEIERFHSTIVEHVKPLSKSSEVPSWSWIRNSGIRRLIDALVFHFREFKLSGTTVKEPKQTFIAFGRRGN